MSGVSTRREAESAPTKVPMAAARAQLPSHTLFTRIPLRALLSGFWATERKARPALVCRDSNHNRPTTLNSTSHRPTVVHRSRAPAISTWAAEPEGNNERKGRVREPQTVLDQAFINMSRDTVTRTEAAVDRRAMRRISTASITAPAAAESSMAAGRATQIDHGRNGTRLAAKVVPARAGVSGLDNTRAT